LDIFRVFYQAAFFRRSLLETKGAGSWSQCCLSSALLFLGAASAQGDLCRPLSSLYVGKASRWLVFLLGKL